MRHLDKKWLMKGPWLATFYSNFDRKRLPEGKRRGVALNLALSKARGRMSAHLDPYSMADDLLLLAARFRQKFL